MKWMFVKPMFIPAEDLRKDERDGSNQGFASKQRKPGLDQGRWPGGRPVAAGENHPGVDPGS